MMLECYEQYCKKLQVTGNYRELPASCQNYSLDFSSNDYLQLSRHPDVLAAGIQAAYTWGAGSTGARLLSGHRALFTSFEARIASDVQLAQALLWSSGFQANVNALSSLLNRKVLGARPIVFFDRHNHASLYQAVFLSDATLVRYRHLDYDDLLRCLKDYAHLKVPKWIVTETLFGMDGDVLALDKIWHLAREFGAAVYLDEAHAVGLLGPHGYGVSTLYTHDVPCVVMGTLGKALGSSGAYVASSTTLMTYLVNSAPGFIFSTALPPFSVGAAAEAWLKIRTLDQTRERLLRLGEALRDALVQRGYDVGESSVHIVPIFLRNTLKAHAMYKHLLQQGIRTALIRRPTVPPGTERLRLVLHAGHDEDAIDQLMASLP